MTRDDSQCSRIIMFQAGDDNVVPGDGADFRRLMGVFPRNDNSYRLAPIKESVVDDINEALPADFDARGRWPKCLSLLGSVKDQSNCGSCWVSGVSTSTRRVGFRELFLANAISYTDYLRVCATSLLWFFFFFKKVLSEKNRVDTKQFEMAVCDLKIISIRPKGILLKKSLPECRNVKPYSFRNSAIFFIFVYFYFLCVYFCAFECYFCPRY